MRWIWSRSSRAVNSSDARNLITLSGNRQEIAAMMEAIALFDLDTMKGMSFALMPVKTSAPDAIATELKSVFTSDRGDGPMAGMVQFVPNKRLRSILVISRQVQNLRRARPGSASSTRRCKAARSNSSPTLCRTAVRRSWSTFRLARWMSPRLDRRRHIAVLGPAPGLLTEPPRV
ncbi:hypothetical protein BRAO375_1530018 [Bradyrhizobium sp. ORS 375]|nr:hypothetical protein BRAO375_1530018 [Bradyrhizobium sp. ORS 375]